jgi:7 transmembrane sweet-taste receptor of 3 GCPR
LKLLLTVAADLDAIGPDYLYIFPELDLNTLQQSLQVMDGTFVHIFDRTLFTLLYYGLICCMPYGAVFPDSSLSKVIQGIGFIGMSAGITSERVTQGKVATPTVNENPTTGFERFRLAWKSALQDNAFRQYAQTKLPESFAGMSDIDTDNYFIQDPGGLHAFMYDTVTTFGVAMCRTNSSTNFFTGQDIYDQIRNLELMMASGNVQLSNVGSRIYSSIAFLVWNVRSVGVDSFGLSILEYVPSYGFDLDKWIVLSGNEFIFADGSGIAPESLPVIYHDYNYISRSDRIFGYTLMSIILLSSVGAISWTLYNRKNHVIDAAQPLFLIIVFVGAFIMALSTIPAGFDDSVISSMNGLDAACMAIPWLYFMGSNLSSGALLAKTKAVYGVCFR